MNVFVLNEVQKTDSSNSLLAEQCLGGVHFALDQLVNSAREQNVKPISMVLPLHSEETIATNKVSGRRGPRFGGIKSRSSHDRI